MTTNHIQQPETQTCRPNHVPNGPTQTRRPQRALLTAAAVLLLSSCGTSNDPLDPGTSVDANTSFTELMKLPDIDQAAQRYQQMATELQTALGSQVPALKQWNVADQPIRAACGADHPNLDSAAETLRLENHVAPGTLSDADYEKALAAIGPVVTKHGFTASPQRLHDTPGSHDAVFHNYKDGSSLQFGSHVNTVFSISIGCHLTAETKKLGHIPPTPSY
ncbi:MULTISPECIES: LppA family lipoprotein [Actinomycetes]|uniref:LppA family lipoprotein n=1 Tax=Actinomycetes TaxID=1760 RepID=UPI0001DEEB14|nr:MULTISPECIES: LppA family lipoprotein [Actinomycetes]EFL11059.1 predicted protein [Streptomyces sp. AA4]